MRADTVDLRRIFGKDVRYTVPLFQRPYVWNRDELVHTLGNLTLVTARLNPALGNMPWQDKRLWLGKHSLLRLTHGTLLNPPPTVDAGDWAGTWDENRIRSRGSYLASLALRIWPSADDLLAS